MKKIFFIFIFLLISNNVYATKILKSGFITKSAKVKEGFVVEDPKNKIIIITRLSSFRKYFWIIFNKNNREIELTKIAAIITFTPKKFKIDKIKNQKKSVAPSAFSEFKLKIEKIEDDKINS